mgnify:CR=1 FL=1
MDKFDTLARRVLEDLALDGLVEQANRDQILDAIRRKTPYWRSDRAMDFMRAMEARGYIRHQGFQYYQLKQIGQVELARRLAEAEAKGVGSKPTKRKGKGKRKRVKP